MGRRRRRRFFGWRRILFCGWRRGRLFLDWSWGGILGWVAALLGSVAAPVPRLVAAPVPEAMPVLVAVPELVRLPGLPLREQRQAAFLRRRPELIRQAWASVPGLAPASVPWPGPYPVLNPRVAGGACSTATGADSAGVGVCSRAGADASVVWAVLGPDPAPGGVSSVATGAGSAGVGVCSWAGADVCSVVWAVLGSDPALGAVSSVRPGLIRRASAPVLELRWGQIRLPRRR